MKRAVLIAIGDELLSGIRKEGNCAALAWKLHDAGWDVLRMEVIPDDLPQIVAALERWVGESELVIVSGGLGPTHDDKTRDAIALYLQSPLIEDMGLYEQVISRYRDRMALVNGIALNQSKVPEAAKGVYNPVGTALGIYFERKGTKVWSFPGVPLEFEAMVKQELDGLLLHSDGWASVVLAGIYELQVAERIPEVLLNPELHVSILPTSGTVELIIRGSAEKVHYAENLARASFPDNILPQGCSTLQEAIMSVGVTKGWTVSCAESCTGGMLGGALTETPGSSAVFMGGTVAYSNEIKEKMLGVPSDLLKQHGAVSAECALAMAKGALKAFNTTFAVSITGIAGPDGGSKERPVGTVWIAAASSINDKPVTFTRNFRGSRSSIREYAVRYALLNLWQYMRQS